MSLFDGELMEIRAASANEIFENANCSALLARYAEESAMQGMPPPKADYEQYKKLEKMGVLKVAGAFSDGKLVGLIAVIAGNLPHYSQCVSSTESFFVLREFRRQGTGKKLLALGKEFAAQKGAEGLFVSAPIGSALEKVLSHDPAFEPKNKVFFTPVKTSELTVTKEALPAMSDTAISKVREYSTKIGELPQLPLKTFHLFHAGIYTRTICIFKNTIMTSVLVKCGTLVTINGDVTVSVGTHETRYTGSHIIPVSAKRKLGYYAHEDTWITMQFATDAKTVEEVEPQFTDEVEKLMSHRYMNDITVTGE